MRFCCWNTDTKTSKDTQTCENDHTHYSICVYNSSLSFSKWTHLTTVWPFSGHVPAAVSQSFMLGFLGLNGFPFHPTALLFLTPQQIKQLTFIQMPDSASTHLILFQLINCVCLATCLHRLYSLWLNGYCKSANQNESWELRARHEYFITVAGSRCFTAIKVLNECEITSTGAPEAVQNVNPILLLEIIQ